MLTKNQWSYIRHWIALVVIAESVMLFLNRDLFIIYLIIAILFLGGFCLRSLKLYPGKEEPLILDASAVIISVLFAYISNPLKTTNIRFILIFVSSIIILPHLIYIVYKQDI